MTARLSTKIGSVLLLAMASTAMAAGQITEAHAGTRKGMVYEATPEPYTAPNSGASPDGGDGAVTPSVSPATGGSAPVEAGAGVEIITGGGSSAGAARVGRLPVLQ